MDTNESLSSYRATLLRNGSVLVEAVTVKPGQLGDSTHPIFEFFDWGTYCSPTPCPPPDGPDGNLSVYDYFRISYPDPGTAYTVRVIWAATGNVAGEIVIHTRTTEAGFASFIIAPPMGRPVGVAQPGGASDS